MVKCDMDTLSIKDKAVAEYLDEVIRPHTSFGMDNKSVVKMKVKMSRPKRYVIMYFGYYDGNYYLGFSVERWSNKDVVYKIAK